VPLAGYIAIFFSILSFAALHTIYRIAGRQKCRAEAVNAAFMVSASVSACVIGAIVQPRGFHLPAVSLVRLALLAAITGAMVPLAVAFYMAALKVGKLAPSAMIIGLSVTVPIFGSILLFGEKLTLPRGVAIGLALCSIVLLWLDKRSEDGRSSFDGAQDGGVARPNAVGQEDCGVTCGDGAGGQSGGRRAGDVA